MRTKNAPLLLTPEDIYRAGILRADGSRYDAGETMLFTRELETIMSRVYRVQYTPRGFRTLFPVNSEVPEENVSFTYRQLDWVGAAKPIGNWAADFPTVETKGAEKSHKLFSWGVAYVYSALDLLRAARSGQPLAAEKAFACREAVDNVLESICAVGDSTNGIATGFTNAPNILAVTKGTQASGTTWQNGSGTQLATPGEIVADILALHRAIFEATKDSNKVGDTLLLGTKGYAMLSSAARSSTFTDDTILTYVKRLLPTIQNVYHWAALDTAGASSKERIMLYRKDPSVVEHVLPADFTQAPPQPKNRAFVVNCYATTAGVIVNQPMQVAYMDGTQP